MGRERTIRRIPQRGVKTFFDVWLTNRAFRSTSLSECTTGSKQLLIHSSYLAKRQGMLYLAQVIAWSILGERVDQHPTNEMPKVIPAFKQGHKPSRGLFVRTSKSIQCCYPEFLSKVDAKRRICSNVTRSIFGQES